LSAYFALVGALTGDSGIIYQIDYDYDDDEEDESEWRGGDA